jgi:hypothetical protein
LADIPESFAGFFGNRLGLFRFLRVGGFRQLLRARVKGSPTGVILHPKWLCVAVAVFLLIAFAGLWYVFPFAIRRHRRVP